MSAPQIKPGYWVAWFKPWESYEVVSVSGCCEYFDQIGYDCPTSVKSKDWEFIKPFDPEDIVLNKDFTE